MDYQIYIVDSLWRIMGKQQAVSRDGCAGYEAIILQKAEKRVFVWLQPHPTKVTYDTRHFQAVEQNLYAVIDVAP
jgi:hypothetical protein